MSEPEKHRLLFHCLNIDQISQVEPKPVRDYRELFIYFKIVHFEAWMNLKIKSNPQLGDGVIIFQIGVIVFVV